MTLFELGCQLPPATAPQLFDSGQCQLWCPGEFQTMPFELRMRNQGFIDGQEIFGQQIVTDNQGLDWRFDGLPADKKGEYFTNFDPCGEFLQVQEATTLRPVAAPLHRINYSRPWTLMYIGAVIQGQVAMLTQPGGGNCGAEMTFQLGADTLDPQVSRTQIFTGDLCSAAVLRAEAEWTANHLICIGVAFSVDPCANSANFLAEIMIGTSPVNDEVVRFPGGPDSPTSVSYSVTCANYLVDQPGYDSSIPTRLRPPRLLQTFQDTQEFTIDFSSGLGNFQVDFVAMGVKDEFRNLSQLSTDLAALL